MVDYSVFNYCVYSRIDIAIALSDEKRNGNNSFSNNVILSGWMLETGESQPCLQLYRRWTHVLIVCHKYYVLLCIGFFPLLPDSYPAVMRATSNFNLIGIPIRILNRLLLIRKLTNFLIPNNV